MIWLSRLLIIPVGVIFLLLLLLTLVVLRVNDTLLNPDYYIEELREASIYEFILIDLLTSAVDEARELRGEDLPQGLKENPVIILDLSTEEIVSSINRATPPEYLQKLVEQFFDQFGKYIVGERDEFTVTYEAGEQAETMVAEVKYLARKADVYNFLYDQILIPRIEDAVDLKLPLGVEISRARFVTSVRRTVPSEWVQDRVEYALDETTPYFVGKRDNFEINIQLASRIEIAIEEIKALLGEADAYELLYREIVKPQLTKFLDESADMPFGVTVTNDEVFDALRVVSPPEWVRQQVEMLIDDIGPYLLGRSESFSTEISLKENKRLANGIIADLVDARLTNFVDALPVCTSASELQVALTRMTEGLPRCVPPDVETNDLLDLLEIDVANEVELLLLQPIPDTIKFDELQLRSALILAGAGDNLDRLDEMRKILRDGWSYSQDDLRGDLIEQMDEDAVKMLENVRAFLAHGWTYTEADFRDDLSTQNFGTFGAVDIIGWLDKSRDFFELSRTYKWAIWIPLMFLLVSIGFLGGRNWSGRVTYMAVFLLIAAGIIFIIFGPGYDYFAKSGPIYAVAGASNLSELRQDALDEITTVGFNEFPNTSRLAVNKLFDIVESVIDNLASGIAMSSLRLVIVGLVALAAATFWSAITAMISCVIPEVGLLWRGWFRE